MEQLKTLKEKYGEMVGEKLSNDHFLQEVRVKNPHGPPFQAFQVSEYSNGLDALIYGRVCADWAVFEVRKWSGFFDEEGIHKSQIIYEFNPQEKVVGEESG